MNEFENKGIEKFFRSKLKSPNQNNDWASPPDFIFEKAIDQVNKEEKDKKRKLIFWLSFIGFIVLLSSVIMTQSKQLNDVKKSLNKLEEELITSQLNQEENLGVDDQNSVINSSIEKQKNNAKNNETSVIENKLTLGATSPNSNTNNSIQKNRSSLLNPNQTKSQLNTRNFILQNSEISSDKSILETTDHLQVTPPFKSNTQYTSTGLLNVQAQANSSIAHANRDILSFNFIHPLSQSPFNIQYSKISAIPQLMDRPENKSDFSRGFSIAATTGLNTATLLMDNMSGLDGKELTKYDKYYSGIQSDISLLYHLTSRFSTGIHANYTKINNQSIFVESSSLDPSNMNVVNGKMEYSMPMDIFTPIGSHKMNSQIIFDDNLNTSNLIRNQSDINQTINSIGIGISARYSFIQKSKFNSFVGAGFTHHLSNKTNSEFNTTITMEDKVMKKFKTVPDKMTDNQKTFNSVSAQIGIEYKIAPKTKISFQSSFGKSLNSLRQTNIETDPQTHLQYINTAIGISYSL